MKIKIAIVTIMLAGILTALYFNLGGKAEINIVEGSATAYQLMGKEFVGKYNDAAIDDAYYAVKSMIDDKTVAGELTIVNYTMQGDSTENGWVHQFFGIAISEKKDLPAGYQLLEIPAANVYRIELSVHNLVMPKPVEIEGALNAKAKEQGVTLERYTIERYISDRQLLIEAPILK